LTTRILSLVGSFRIESRFKAIVKNTINYERNLAGYCKKLSTGHKIPHVSFSKPLLMMSSTELNDFADTLISRANGQAGIFFDKDCTLGPAGLTAFPNQLVKLFESLQNAGLPIYILTNDHNSRRVDSFEKSLVELLGQENQVEVIYNANKPNTKQLPEHQSYIFIGDALADLRLSDNIGTNKATTYIFPPTTEINPWAVASLAKGNKSDFVKLIIYNCGAWARYFILEKHLLKAS
jgi:hypothetical protein